MSKPVSRGRIPASKRSSAREAAYQLGIARNQHGQLGEAAFLHKATSLGLMVARPWGNVYRFDFIVQGRGNLLRVQVKACNFMHNGLYHVCTYSRAGNEARSYKNSEIDFVAASIVPEKTWYIFPVHEVANRHPILLRPNKWPRGDPYAYYREAWHLLLDQTASPSDEPQV